MRRSTVPAVLAAITLAGPIVLLEDAPAQAASVFVEINPSTVSAGDQIGLRASCTDNLAAATVSSTVFPDVSVSPQYGFLTAAVQVPAATKAGDYKVRLRCPDGAAATATLHVVSKVRPSRGPATGGGGTAGGGAAGMLLGGGIVAMAGGLALGVLTLRRRRVG
jgi:hypothetical protein